MKTKILKTEQEYNSACERLYSLMHSTEKPIEPDNQAGEEMELLSLLVEKYEEEQYLMAPPPLQKAGTLSFRWRSL